MTQAAYNKTFRFWQINVLQRVIFLKNSFKTTVKVWVVECLNYVPSSTTKPLQNVYEAEIWCLCTVTFGQKFKKIELQTGLLLATLRHM